MKKEKGLTVKENKFLKDYVLTGNATEAAMRVYNCKTRASAAVLGNRMLRKVKILDEVEFWLNKMGITDKRIAKQIKEGLEATKTISAVSGKTADEKTMDFIDVPDWNARNKVLELVLKMRGRLVEKNINWNKDEKIEEIKFTIVDNRNDNRAKSD